MESIELFIAAMGIPSAICGLLVWWFKRRVEARDAQVDERERNLEKLMLMMMQTTRANNVLAVATARAVQRIPGAQCNGDMTAALEEAARLQSAEKDFLVEQGVKHIFGE
jgi:uncharacterized protein YigA (DUF484 family)